MKVHYEIRPKTQNPKHTLTKTSINSKMGNPKKTKDAAAKKEKKGEKKNAGGVMSLFSCAGVSSKVGAVASNIDNAQDGQPISLPGELID